MLRILHGVQTSYESPFKFIVIEISVKVSNKIDMDRQSFALYDTHD